MAIICKLINATTGGVLNKDSDIQALAHTIMNEGIIADADTSDFEVTAGQVGSGGALIEVTRTNTTPEEKFMLYVWNQQDEAKTLGSNKKIFIQIPLVNINDNTLNTNPTGSGIATIEVEDAYPATDYYLSLGETDGSGNITDTRVFTTIKGSLLDSVASTDITGGNWKVFYTNGSGINTELALGDATKVLTSNGAAAAPTFESPTVDINSLSEKTSTIANDDMLIVYDPGVGNKKHLAQASVTNEGLVEMCTDAEVLAHTDKTRYINSKQVFDNYQSVSKQYILVADVNPLYSDLTAVGTATVDITWQDRKSFTSNSDGTVNISAVLDTVGMNLGNAQQNKLRFLQVRGGNTIYTSSEFIGDTTLKTCSVGPLTINFGDIIKIQGYWNNAYNKGKIQDFYGKATLTSVNPLI